MEKKGFNESQLIMYGAFIGLLLLILLPVSHKVLKIEEEKKYENNIKDVIEASKKLVKEENIPLNRYINIEDLLKTKYISKTKLTGCIKATYNEVNKEYNYTYINSRCEDIITLKDRVISNITDSNDGLYKVNDKYIYKGMNPDNYIMIDNTLYRILEIDKDGIKVISNKSIANKSFDDDNSRNNDDNIYCKNSVNGCNIYMSNGIDVKDDSDIYEYLENVYTNNHNIMLVKTNWNLGLLSDLNVENINQIVDNNITSSIGLLNISDYMMTNLDGDYTHSWLVNNEDFWTFTGVKGTNNIVWCITSNGIIDKSYADNILGVRPIINLSSNIKVTGLGTLESPYILR